MINITILNFSARQTGNCAAVAEHIHHTFVNTNIHLYLISSIFTPCNSCNYQCLRSEEICPNLNERQRNVMDQILRSDLVYYIIPNYCGVPCANYYAFNERIVGYFNGNRDLMADYRNVLKRFVMISNTESPAFEAVAKQHTDGEAKVLYLKSSKYAKSSISGDLLVSQDAMSDLIAFLDYDIKEL